MIQPGSCIGILGGGQLGKMIGLAAREMGYRLAVFDAGGDCVACPVADSMCRSGWDDEEALVSFAKGCDVITLEFENIDTAAIRRLAEIVTVHPGAEVLATCQNRMLERAFLTKGGYPQPANRLVHTPAELAAAVAELGLPCVLKTVAWGYDGKGQVKIAGDVDFETLWSEWGGGPGVVEEFVDFECELSALCTRSAGGEVRVFPVPRNTHRDHILDTSVFPSGLGEDIVTEASDIAADIVRALECVGMLAVEFFLTRDGRLLINELAPRPHNSGHFTMNGCVTSQFEQHVRAVCGLPLGETHAVTACGMWNLLGHLWAGGQPRWDRLLANPNAKLHLYGKAEARKGRKMGHVNVLGQTVEEIAGTIGELRAAMEP